MTTLWTTQWSMPAGAVLAVAALAVALLVALTLLSVAQRRTRRQVEAMAAAPGALEAAIETLHTAVDEQQAPMADAAANGVRQEYVITSLGALHDPTVDPVATETVTLSAPAFADAVLRESVVHTASFLHGVRRALAPEARNRIRFEMRRELKRTRKERKVEVREALREYRARHRAQVTADAPGGLADGAA